MHKIEMHKSSNNNGYNSPKSRSKHHHHHHSNGNHGHHQSFAYPQEQYQKILKNEDVHHVQRIKSNPNSSKHLNTTNPHNYSKSNNLLLDTNNSKKSVTKGGFLTSRSARSSSSVSDSDDSGASLSQEMKQESSRFLNSTNDKVVMKSARNVGSASNRLQSPVSIERKLNEYRNRIYMLEIELENEKKKANIEKELRTKTIFELKSRYDTEKNAALRALEARINAEKLEEFNKHKESLEAEKMNEIEVLCKNKDVDVFNMKMKLREKAERISKLESIIKEERLKSNQTHKKSFEVIEKYSMEIKSLRMKLNASRAHKVCEERTTQTSEVYRGTNVDKLGIDSYTQTEEVLSNNRLVSDNLRMLHKNLRIDNKDVSSESNMDLRYIKDIEGYMNEMNNEKKHLLDNIDALREDLKQLGEAKTKLEVLYKVKCKSDLDKSATIKKLKLNYEMELMKFRNEENYDLVNYLEKQLNVKEVQLLEQSFELESWRSADNTIASNYNGNGNGMISSNGLANNNDISYTSFSQSMKPTSSVINKKIAPIDVIFSSDPDVVISTNCRSTTAEVDHKNCMKKNRELQEKIYSLEKQLLIFRNMKETNKETVKVQETNEDIENKEEKNNQVAEIQRLKAKLNQFAAQVSTNNADLIKHNSYQNTKELEKLLKQSNKEKLILEREFSLKQNQQFKNITKDVNETYSVPTNNSHNSASANLTTNTALNATNRSNESLSSPQLHHHQQQQQQQQQQQHYLMSNNNDPLYYSALQDTNNALKIEVHRLAPYETKCKILEEKAANAAAELKEQNEKYEKQLSKYKSKCEHLDGELQQFKKLKQHDEDQMHLLQNQMDSNEQELKQARRQLKDTMDKLNEYEKQIDAQKAKEAHLEKLNRTLDADLKDLKAKSVNAKLQEQKLDSIEQANRILEHELTFLKKQHTTDKSSSNEKMVDLEKKVVNLNELNLKLNEENKKLILKLNELHEKYEGLNDHLSNVKLREDEIRAQMEQYENIIRQQNGDFDCFKIDFDKLNDEKCHLEANLRKHEDKNKELSKSLKDKQDEIDSLEALYRNDIEKMETALIKINQENQNLTNEFNNVNKNCKLKDTEIDDLKRHVTELRSSKQSDINTQKYYELNETNMKLKHDMNELQMIIETERVEHRHMIDKQTTEYRFNMDNLTQRLHDQILKYDCLVKENNHLKSELSLFEEKFANYEMEMKTKKTNSRTASIDDDQLDLVHRKNKILEDKLNIMQNDISLKEQENQHLIKQLDSERSKITALIKQLDDVQQSNTRTITELNESKERFYVLESNLRDSNDKSRQIEINNEATLYELKKKQDELKKLQMIHETIKKEHMDTIELLEEKLRDLEKKTELQAIKHEEVMLELESIRAKRERTMPICPHCSTQTIQYYQSPPQQSQYHQYSCMKNQETQTSLLNSMNQLELIVNNELKQVLDASKHKVKMFNKEVNTDKVSKMEMKHESVMAVISNEKFEKYTQSEMPSFNEINLYICKYAYNPYENSPNDNPEMELKLSAGEHLFILSDKDDDGFFMGQLLDGKRGMVPSNFVEKCENLTKDVYQQIVARSLATKFVTNEEAPVNVKPSPPPPALIEQSPDSQDASKQLLKSQASASQQPFPINMHVDKKVDTNTLIVTWDPPTDFSHQEFDLSYQVYLNQEMYCFIKQNQRRVAVIEKVDLKVENRISIQAISQKGASKPQECTLLYGPDIYYAPTNLKVYNITQTSAIVSWWPSSSTQSHIITINNTEHRSLKAGIYRFKLSGLVPDTVHKVTIASEIPSNSSNPKYSAHIDFTTLAIPVPTNVRLQKASNSTDLYTLLWQPVAIDTNQPIISGYAIYLDGSMVHQILDPNANMINLNTKLLSKDASYITIRSLSFDGNYESKDSEKILLASYTQDEINKPLKQQKINQSNSNENLFEARNSNTVSDSANEGIKVAALDTVKTQKERSSSELRQSQQYASGKALNNDSVNQTKVRSKKYKLEHQNSSDSQSSKSATNEKPIKTKVNKVKPNEEAYYQNVHEQNINNNRVQSNKNVKHNEMDAKSKKQQDVVNKRIFIALFNYDPYTMSPNIETCHEELPLQEGQLIKVIGDQDADGFYFGECQGKSGFIPCNMISEVQLDDPYILEQLMSDTNSPGINSNTTYTQNSNKKKNETVLPTYMIALYDYDPQSLSPNNDCLDTELSFKIGDIIAVYGNMDSDGFFIGELNGKRGLVPSNFLQEYDLGTAQNHVMTPNSRKSLK